MKRMLMIVMVLALFLFAATGCGGGSNGGGSIEPSGGAEIEVSENSIMAEIEIADYGTITVALDPDAAPVTVENFTSLAKDGFYDGLTFHRIISGFMIQGGDPNGNGTGGSGENIVGEFTANGVDNPLQHIRGAVSMARSMDNDSASSQFFIVHEDSPHLNGQYAVFGYVTNGLNIVDAVCERVQPSGSNGEVEAEYQPVITTVRILE